MKTKTTEQASRADCRAAVGSVTGNKFYDGIEWFACWLLDNCEGEEITEEQLRPWAAKALKAHEAQND